MNLMGDMVETLTEGPIEDGLRIPYKGNKFAI